MADYYFSVIVFSQSFYVGYSTSLSVNDASQYAQQRVACSIALNPTAVTGVRSQTICYGIRNFSVISGSNRSNCKAGFTNYHVGNSIKLTRAKNQIWFRCLSLTLIAITLLPANDNRFNKQENACHRPTYGT